MYPQLHLQLVGPEVAHYDDMATPQFWAEHGVQVREEEFGIGGHLNCHGGRLQ